MASHGSDCDLQDSVEDELILGGIIASPRMLPIFSPADSGGKPSDVSKTIPSRFCLLEQDVNRFAADQPHGLRLHCFV